MVKKTLAAVLLGLTSAFASADMITSYRDLCTPSGAPEKERIVYLSGDYPYELTINGETPKHEITLGYFNSYGDCIGYLDNSHTINSTHPRSGSGVWFEQTISTAGFEVDTIWKTIEARVNVDDSYDSKGRPTFSDDEIFEITNPNTRRTYVTHDVDGNSVSALKVLPRNIYVTPEPVTSLVLSGGLVSLLGRRRSN
jgi:hypothetical protein